MFALGASIGSFMNVVVYRLPAGLSLVHPGSRCPQCKTPLAARDNIPIFGWLWLRGRCRYCGLPISARYPLVESLVACMFALLAASGPLAGGANLPGFANRTPVEEAIDWPLWGVYGYHLFLLCGLICAALTEFDGHRSLPRLALPLFFVGAIGPLFWPELHPVSSGLVSDESLMLQPWLAGIVDSLAGLGAGILLALAAWPATRERATASVNRPYFSLPNLAIAFSCTGLFLGWQAVSVLASLAPLGQLILAIISRVWPAARRIGWIATLAPLTFGWLLFWRALETDWPFVGSAADVRTFAAAAAITGALAWLACRLRRQQLH